MNPKPLLSFRSEQIFLEKRLLARSWTRLFARRPLGSARIATDAGVCEAASRLRCQHVIVLIAYCNAMPSMHAAVVCQQVTLVHVA